MRTVAVGLYRFYNAGMSTLEFHQVDVFTNRALGGNALAVFPKAKGLKSQLMQALARETNLSETTFITSRDKERRIYTVRIFTPFREVVFAGHPTIGTASLLFAELPDDKPQITLNLQVGHVPVAIDRRGKLPLIYFTPPLVAAGAIVDDVELLARLCGLKADELDLARAPAEIVTFGMSFLITPVKSREIMERVQIDVPTLHELHRRYGCDLLTVFCLDAYQRGSMASTRVFAPLHGVSEDPATGSSASCLAWYLRDHGLIPDCGAHWLKLDQGYSVARPSLIQLRANQQANGAIEVSIGGHVVPIARGDYVLP